MRTPLLLFVLALALHTAWRLTMPVPEDWDALYYSEVARRIAAGQGATTLAVWNLSFLPASLPAPADLHWMPLPSRVFALGALLWPAAGDVAVAVLVAALVAPATWALAREARLGEPEAIAAALLATTGGVLLRPQGTTDVYGLAALIGAVAFVAAARERWKLVVLLCALAALTRGDGFWLAPALALAAHGPWRLLVALSGPLAAALWWARNLLVAGPEWAASRGLVGRTARYADLYDGVLTDPAGVADRLATLPRYLEVLVSPGLVVLVPALVLGGAALREQRWTRAFLAFFLLAPLLSLLAAPAVAAHGTVFRTQALALAPHGVLAAAGLWKLGRLARSNRDLAPGFVIALLLGAYVVGTLGVAWKQIGEPPPPCPSLPEGAVFSSEPLAMSRLCDRPAVMITRTLPPERAQAVAERYDVRWALARPSADEASLRPEDVQDVLPEWEEVAPGVWRRP